MKIFIPYDEVWNYFQENKTRLLYTCDEIACSEGENDRVSVFLTEENGRPRLTVETDGVVLESEEVISCRDCEETVFNMYKSIKKGEGDPNKEEMEAQVSQREAELCKALKEFLNVAFDSDDFYDDDELSSILDSIEERIHDDFGYIMHRPIVIDHEFKSVLLNSIFEEEEFW